RALASRLGVDVERVSADPVRSADLGRLLGVPPDAALQRWTGVEAVLKADGRGLRTDPGQVRFSPGSARLEGTPHAYRVERVPDASGFEISVAWLPSAP
ncbi:MAG: hypothetical protein KDB60_15450, partial [Propionibacteriaceae bacterium]|nr:hypothetical protein [Propionibacteriaceae bacterium]